MELISFTIHSEDGVHLEESRPPGTYILGRDPGCDIVLPSIGVSRRHVRLKVSETSVEIQDLGSSAGTFVNEVQITSATILELPAQIMLGHMAVTVYSQKRPLHRPEEAPAAAPEARGRVKC
jgi:pSer/pThr/pTyr-binding forkhead associated (FHA) protein